MLFVSVKPKNLPVNVLVCDSDFSDGLVFLHSHIYNNKNPLQMNQTARLALANTLQKINYEIYNLLYIVFGSISTSNTNPKISFLLVIYTLPLISGVLMHFGPANSLYKNFTSIKPNSINVVTAVIDNSYVEKEASIRNKNYTLFATISQSTREQNIISQLFSPRTQSTHIAPNHVLTQYRNQFFAGFTRVSSNAWQNLSSRVSAVWRGSIIFPGVNLDETSLVILQGEVNSVYTNPNKTKIVPPNILKDFLTTQGAPKVNATTTENVTVVDYSKFKKKDRVNFEKYITNRLKKRYSSFRTAPLKRQEIQVKFISMWQLADTSFNEKLDTALKLIRHSLSLGGQGLISKEKHLADMDALRPLIFSISPNEMPFLKLFRGIDKGEALYAMVHKLFTLKTNHAVYGSNCQLEDSHLVGKGWDGFDFNLNQGTMSDEDHAVLTEFERIVMPERGLPAGGYDLARAMNTRHEMRLQTLREASKTPSMIKRPTVKLFKDLWIESQQNNMNMPGATAQEVIKNGLNLILKADNLKKTTTERMLTALNLICVESSKVGSLIGGYSAVSALPPELLSNETVRSITAFAGASVAAQEFEAQALVRFCATCQKEKPRAAKVLFAELENRGINQEHLALSVQQAINQKQTDIGLFVGQFLSAASATTYGSGASTP